MTYGKITQVGAENASSAAPVEQELSEFPRRLRAALQQTGLKSERSFARMVDISASSLQNYLDGKQVPGLDKAARIALATKTSIGWLATGKAETDLDFSLNLRMLQEELAALPSHVTANDRDRIQSQIDDLALAKDRFKRAFDIQQDRMQHGFMATVEGGGEAEARYLPEDFRLIPRLNVTPAAGPGAMVESEDQVGVLAFRSEWLHRRGINATAAHVLTARGDSMEPTIRDGDILLVDTSIDRVIDNAIYVVVYAGRTLVKRVQLKLDGSVGLGSDNRAVFDDETVPAADVGGLNIAGRVMWFGRSI